MTIPILYCLVSGSAITDIIKGKIFNLWLSFGALLGLAICFADFLQGRGAEGIIRALVTFLVLLPVYLAGGIGGGDLKLFSVIALFISSEEMIACTVLSFCIGALAGVIKTIWKREKGQTIHFALPILASVLMVTETGVLVCM